MQVDKELNSQPNNEIQGEDRKEKGRLYSQVVGDLEEPVSRRRIRGEVDMSWADEVSRNLEKVKKANFDESEWHYAKVIEAFKDGVKMRKFIIHKLETKPADHTIPVAIALKFKHSDRNFFRTFTRNNLIMPTHQKEYKAILESAMENYKGKNSVTYTNREIRNKSPKT